MDYIGIDQHKRFSQVAVLSEDGNIQQYKLYHDDKECMKKFFFSYQDKASVTMEATGNWYWLYDMLEELDIQVKLAHPLKTRAIAEARIKTDKIDAQTLAYLDKANLVAEAYLAPASIRDQRQRLRYRQSLVQIRSGIKCRIHALLDQQGFSTLFCADLFGKKGLQYLKGLSFANGYQESLDGYLLILERLNEQIDIVTAEIRKCIKKDPRADLLMTIPGVGIIIGYLLLAEIGDIRRFFSQDKLCAYAGLVPSTYQTGNTCYHGHITKQGNKYIRWAMTEAAQRAIKQDPSLSFFYNKLLHKKGASKAKVAVARKLLTAAYQILKKEVPYKLNTLTRINMGKPVNGSGHHE